ncbi:MAG TPA: hypothetical protein VFJ14_13570 [Nocardioidaceae bacterium]|nr:hypothetical protein [Nocardioidaceae bacterium]
MQRHVNHGTGVEWVSVLGHSTVVNATNRAGEVVGVFRSGHRVHAFRQDTDRVQHVLEIPGAMDTFAQRITDDGTVAGDYTDTRGRHHGFVHDGVRTRPVDHPGAAHTWVTGINRHGQLAGCWQDRDGEMHGFVLDGTEFRPVNSAYVLDIDDDGTVVAVGRPRGGQPPLLIGQPNHLHLAPEPTWQPAARQWSALAGDRLHLAGHYRAGVSSHAMAFDGSRRQCIDLRFAGSRRSSATGVCADGSVVGYVEDQDGRRRGFVLPERLAS